MWSLNCPPDYVALGYIATESPNYPEMGDIYCVRRYFVELGNLEENIQKDVWSAIWDSGQYKSSPGVTNVVSWDNKSKIFKTNPKFQSQI